MFHEQTQGLFIIHTFVELMVFQNLEIPLSDERHLINPPEGGWADKLPNIGVRSYLNYTGRMSGRIGPRGRQDGFLFHL
jgi:hypothetical protein